MPRGRKTSAAQGGGDLARSYKHPEATNLMRPEVGTQAQFRKKKPPVTYRYDSSLSPALDWDGGNSARELGEWLLCVIEKAAALAPPHVLHLIRCRLILADWNCELRDQSLDGDFPAASRRELELRGQERDPGGSSKAAAKSRYRFPLW